MAIENNQRFCPLDSSIFYSQEEIKAYADANGIRPDMVEIDKRGELVFKSSKENLSQPVK